MAGPASCASPSDQRGLSGTSLGSLHSGSSGPHQADRKGLCCSGLGQREQKPCFSIKLCANVGFIAQKPPPRDFQNMREFKIPVDDTLDDMGARFADACRRAERGETVQERHLSFDSFEGLARTRTPRRLELL